MLDAADLAFVQQAIQEATAAVGAACAIQRQTTVSDGMGGTTSTWATISASGLTCRVTQPSTTITERVAEGRLETADRWLLGFPAGQDVQPGDRVLVFGFTYLVESAGPTTQETERVAQCVRLF